MSAFKVKFSIRYHVLISNNELFVKTEYSVQVAEWEAYFQILSAHLLRADLYQICLRIIQNRVTFLTLKKNITALKIAWRVQIADERYLKKL